MAGVTAATSSRSTSPVVGPQPPATRPPPTRAQLRPRRFTRNDYFVLGGCGLSAIALVWVFYYRLAPLTSRPGYWVITYAVFVLMYFVVVRQMYGKLEAIDRVMTVVIATAAGALIVPLVMILLFVIGHGLAALEPNFFTETLEFVGPLDPATAGGALHAIVGTLEQVAIAMVITVPLGVTTAVFLNEVGGRLTRPIRFVVDAMSGVPSIVAGLFIYSLLIVELGQDFSGFAAGLALSVLMLPTITRTSEEVLRLVPGGLRESALALGASEWRAVRMVVLPTARAGVITAVILGVARAVGETAPLIMTSFGSSFLNANPLDGAQASLPLFVFRLLNSPQQVQKDRAYTGGLVLIFMVLVLFTVARIIGNRKPGARRMPLFSGSLPSSLVRRRRLSSTTDVETEYEAELSDADVANDQGSPL